MAERGSDPSIRVQVNKLRSRLARFIPARLRRGPTVPETVPAARPVGTGTLNHHIKSITNYGRSADGTLVSFSLETHEGPTFQFFIPFMGLGFLISTLQQAATLARNIRVSKGDPAAVQTRLDLEAAGEFTTALEIMTETGSTDVILRLIRKSGAVEHVRLAKDVADTLFTQMGPHVIRGTTPSPPNKAS